MAGTGQQHATTVLMRRAGCIALVDGRDSPGVVPSSVKTTWWVAKRAAALTPSAAVESVAR